LFLDKNNTILEQISELPPNKVTKVLPFARSVLELAPGTIKRYHIETGDRLEIVAEGKHRPDIQNLRNLFHWPVNFIIALMWSRFVVALFGNLLEKPNPASLGILIHNTILLFLFLTRRKSTDTSSRVFDWAVPILTMIAAMLLRPHPLEHPGLSLVSAIIQSIGIVLILISLLTLGRSFGIIPANRRIKYSGAYTVVRHPVYTSELIFYLSFFLGNISLRNGLLILLIVMGQLWRSIAEERILSKDSQYREYMNRVRYRFIPGLF
jgi:protein-S-isoprenylcysteine O-methyltransferase Ste14